MNIVWVEKDSKRDDSYYVEIALGDERDVVAFDASREQLQAIVLGLTRYLVKGEEKRGTEEICREWRDAVTRVEFPRPALSQLRHMPAYVHQVKEIMRGFQELCGLLRGIQIL